jgi:hypothetical protein
MCKSHRRPKTKSTMTRRQMLAVTGKASALASIFDPVQILLNSMVDGLITEARAAGTGVKPRHYVHIALSGGPQRWSWDSPLCAYETNGPAAMTASPNVINAFANNATANAGQGAYRTAPFTYGGRTINMPIMWSGNIPIPGGGNVPMANLLQHMLMVRGVNMLQDGHPNNMRRQIRPNPSAPSLGGRVADYLSAPVPSVALLESPWEDYKSEKGIGQVRYTDFSLGAGSGGNLATLLAPFNASGDQLNGTFVSRRDALNQALRSALTSLGTYANSSNPGASNLYDMANNAETRLRQGVGNASTEYSTLYAKYQALITSCANQLSTPALILPGIMDKPVLAANYASQLKNAGTDGLTATVSDLRSVINANTNVVGLAGSFAIIEYLLKHGYSCSIMAGINDVNGLNYTGTANGGWDFDEHSGGSVLSAIVNGFMYQALSACIYELATVLSAVPATTPSGSNTHLFNETVIHIGGEFSRKPADSNDGRGSEHGWRAAVATIISGAVRAPLVLGNILKDADPAATWGAAAPVEVDGEVQELTIGHATSTVAEILRIERLATNNSSLAIETSSGVTETIERGRIV